MLSVMSLPCTKALFEPTMCQYDWKNIAGIPSGPGDFQGPIWKAALRTSYVVIGAKRPTFILSETLFSKTAAASTKPLGLVVVNMSSKYLTKALSILAGSLVQTPLSSVMPAIKFFLLFMDALLWKYFVLLSPSWSH